MHEISDLPDLTTRILNRLKESKNGCSFEELTDFLPAPGGDVRAILYDLLEAKCVRFADGRWRLDSKSFSGVRGYS
jgi:DNA-binding IclR family transcriptional regulator